MLGGEPIEAKLKKRDSKDLLSDHGTGACREKNAGAHLLAPAAERGAENKCRLFARRVQTTDPQRIARRTAEAALELVRQILFEPPLPDQAPPHSGSGPPGSSGFDPAKSVRNGRRRDETGQLALSSK